MGRPGRCRALTTPTASPPGPDGNLWFTDPIIVNGRAVTAAVGSISPRGSDPGIRGFVDIGPAMASLPGPDGNLWFAEYGTNSARAGHDRRVA